METDAEKFYAEHAKEAQVLEGVKKENEDLKVETESQRRDIVTLQENVNQLASQNAEFEDQREAWEKSTQQSQAEIEELSRVSSILFIISRF